MKTFDEACQLLQSKAGLAECIKGSRRSRAHRDEVNSKYRELIAEIDSNRRVEVLLFACMAQLQPVEAMKNMFIYGVLVGIEMEKP